MQQQAGALHPHGPLGRRAGTLCECGVAAGCVVRTSCPSPTERCTGGKEGQGAGTRQGVQGSGGGCRTNPSSLPWSEQGCVAQASAPPPEEGQQDDGHLRPPTPQRQFLISPPASPPVGWEPSEEQQPGINYDIIAALAGMAPGGSLLARSRFLCCAAT